MSNKCQTNKFWNKNSKILLSLIHEKSEFWNKNSKILLSLIREKSDFWSKHNKISRISQKCKLFRKYHFLIRSAIGILFDCLKGGVRDPRTCGTCLNKRFCGVWRGTESL